MSGNFMSGIFGMVGVGISGIVGRLGLGIFSGILGMLGFGKSGIAGRLGLGISGIVGPWKTGGLCFDFCGDETCAEGEDGARDPMPNAHRSTSG